VIVGQPRTGTTILYDLLALDPGLRASLYPFCRLTGPANVLIMPGLHAAHILTRSIPRLTSANVIGPLLTGLSHSAQIVPMQAGVNQMLDVACLAARRGPEMGGQPRQKYHGGA
jgi:phosphotransacetylase